MTTKLRRRADIERCECADPKPMDHSLTLEGLCIECCKDVQRCRHGGYAHQCLVCEMRPGEALDPFAIMPWEETTP